VVAIQPATHALTPGVSASQVRTLVRALSIATFLQWLGASTVLPILPIYLSNHGASDTVIGIAMGAFFAAGVVAQYPIGKLTDRVGQTRVLMSALVLYAVASVGFLLPVGPWADIGLRALQGAAAGAAEVAALSMVGRYVPEDRRGAAFGSVFGAQLSAVAVGPLLGSIAGVRYMGVLFVLAGVAAIAACIPIRTRAAALTAQHPPLPVTDEPRVRLRAVPGLPGVFVVALIVGLTAGVYEACWTLLLQFRGAAAWEIGLSWSLFCIPFVAMSVPAGRLADRYDRRWLVIMSLLSSVVLIFIYPYVPSVPWMIALGAVEGLGTSIAFPAAQSLLSQLAPLRQIGHTQGTFSALQTAATAVAAALGGALFGAATWLPFVAAGAVAGLLLMSLPFAWRSITGRSPAFEPLITQSNNSDAVSHNLDTTAASTRPIR
jgi:MFS family permease